MANEANGLRTLSEDLGRDIGPVMATLHAPYFTTLTSLASQWEDGMAALRSERDAAIALADGLAEEVRQREDRINELSKDLTRAVHGADAIPEQAP